MPSARLPCVIEHAPIIRSALDWEAVSLARRAASQNSADGGILVSGEYEFDLVKYYGSRAFDKTSSDEKQTNKPYLRKLAPLVFLDYGRARIKHPVAPEKGHEELFSAGVGMLVELGDHFSAAVYYGCPLIATEDTDRGEGCVNIGLMMRW